MTETLRTAVEKKQRAALLIWGALTGGMVCYAAIAGLVLVPMMATDTPVNQRDLESIVFAVVGLAFVMAGAAIVIYRAANTEEGMLKILARKPIEKDPAFTGEEQRLLAVAQQIAKNSIIATAVCDGIAVLGLVLTLLTYRADYVYVSAGFGVMISLLIMPRITEATELAEALLIRRTQ